MSSIQSVVQEGMAAAFAARMDPNNAVTTEFIQKQMQLLEDEVIQTRIKTLETLEKKIERLKADGADGRTIEVYQSLLERLASTQGV